MQTYQSPGASSERPPAPEPDSGINRSGDPLFMTSLARGLHVIRAFSGPRRRRSIADISRATGLPRAAVRRCLYTLRELGFVGCEGHAYWLLPKVLDLGYAALSGRRDRIAGLGVEPGQ